MAEVNTAVLEEIADLIPKAKELSPYPAVSRDLNLVVDEKVRWADLAATVRTAAGQELENIEYRDTYRDPKRLGAERRASC